MSENHRVQHRVGAVIVAGALVLAGCGGGSTSPAPGAAAPSTAPTTVGATIGTQQSPSGPAGATFPGAQWERIDPAAAGMDAAKLEEIAQRAEAAGSTCLAVFRDGKLVKDWYWNGSSTDNPQETFSTTKSFTSTLVGIAQDEGKLDIDDKASKYIPEWAGTPSDAVTLKHLLSNNSGRHWDAITDYVTMTPEADKTAFAIGLGQDVPPDTTWAYNNAAIQTFSTVLKKATGENGSDYAKHKLLDPIGMTNSRINQDASGNPLMYYGLQSTCLDMARFGHLLLNRGNWNGRQIVSESYVDEATGRASQDINGAYGYLFWVNRAGRMAGATKPATRGVDDDRPITHWVPGAPEDMFWAAGVGGQTIQIDPGTGTVVTRLGSLNKPEGVDGFDRKQTAEVVTKAMVTK